MKYLQKPTKPQLRYIKIWDTLSQMANLDIIHLDTIEVKTGKMIMTAHKAVSHRNAEFDRFEIVYYFCHESFYYEQYLTDVLANKHLDNISDVEIIWLSKGSDMDSVMNSLMDGLDRALQQQ